MHLRREYNSTHAFQQVCRSIERSLTPILAERFDVDPAVLSAPLTTTMVGATGLIIYFSIAKLILRVSRLESPPEVKSRED